MKRIKKFYKENSEIFIACLISGATGGFLAYKFLDDKRYIGFEPAFDEDQKLSAIVLARKDGLFDVLTKKVDTGIGYQ